MTGTGVRRGRGLTTHHGGVRRGLGAGAVLHGALHGHGAGVARHGVPDGHTIPEAILLTDVVRWVCATDIPE